MTVRVICKTREIYSAEVKSVSVPGQKGWLGIFPGHSPTVAVLTKGQIIVALGGKIVEIAISDGVMEVADDVVTIHSKSAQLLL